ncbi:MAG: hypothetical protein WCI67_11650 [Chloroflexales bacterium]
MQQLIFLVLGTCIVMFVLWMITQFLDMENGYGLYISLILFGILMMLVATLLASSISIIIFRS